MAVEGGEHYVVGGERRAICRLTAPEIDVAAIGFVGHQRKTVRGEIVAIRELVGDDVEHHRCCGDG